MIAKHLRFAGLLVAFALMYGCAVVDYKQPVDTLNTAISDSAKTFSALDDNLTQLHNEQLREMIQSGMLSLEIVDGSCALGTKNCSLRVLFKDQSTNPFPATSLMPKARLALNGLTTYAQRLKAITDADTASQVATSANEALVSIQNLTTTIATETGNKNVIENCRRLPGTNCGRDRMVRNPVRGICEVQGSCTGDEACPPGHLEPVRLVRNLRRSRKVETSWPMRTTSS